VCHRLALVGLALTPASGLGCATQTGWAISDVRVCAPKAAPRVCVIGEPDFGHVVGVGDLELLPGECGVAAGPHARGGLSRVSTRGRDGTRRARRVAVRRGAFTLIAVEGDGRFEVSRARCDQQPVAP